MTDSAQPGRNIFGELNPLTDVQEYMRLNGIVSLSLLPRNSLRYTERVLTRVSQEPNYSATTSAKSGSSPPAPTNPVRGSR